MICAGRVYECLLCLVILSFGNVLARNLVMLHGCVIVSDLVSLTTSFYYLGFVQPCGLVSTSCIELWWFVSPPFIIIYIYLWISWQTHVFLTNNHHQQRCGLIVELPIWAESNLMKKPMVILRNLFYNNALFGLVSYNDPDCYGHRGTPRIPNHQTPHTTKFCIWNWNQGHEKGRHVKSQRSQNYTVGIFLVSESSSETWKSLTLLAQEISDPKSETCFERISRSLDLPVWVLNGMVFGVPKYTIP